MSNSIISTLVLAAAAVALLWAPGAASAAPCSDVVPATNSELDQYVETIPGACGDQQVGGGSDGGSGSSTGSGSSGGGSGGGETTAGSSAVVPLAAETQSALEALGADGAAAAELAERTSPSPAGEGAGTASGSGDTASEVPESTVGFSPGSAVSGMLKAFGGGTGSGMGVAAPILLGSIALAGVAFLVLRRRSLVGNSG